MALGFLASRFFDPEKLKAFTVDHNLSHMGVNENADSVKSRLSEMGIACEVLKLDWKDFPVSAQAKGKLQSTARDKRYQALLQSCAKEDIDILLTAHNVDDDVATMLYRMAHMSGIEGVAGMKCVTTFPVIEPFNLRDIFIGRPFIGHRKVDLINTCIKNNIEWNVDTSNFDIVYRRNAIGHLVHQMGTTTNSLIGLDRLGTTLNHLKLHRKVILEHVLEFFKRSVILNKLNGDVTIVLNNPMYLTKGWVLSTAIKFAVQFVTASGYPPKTNNSDELTERVLQAYKSQIESRKERRRLPTSFERLHLGQTSFANAVIYPLAKSDSINRISSENSRKHRSIEPGPCLLITREFSDRKKESHGHEVSFNHTNEVLWKNAFYVRLNGKVESACIYMRELRVLDVKRALLLARGHEPARKVLYDFVRSVSALHYHAIPVLLNREDPNFICIPTLGVKFPVDFDFTIQFKGGQQVTSKFLCLP